MKIGLLRHFKVKIELPKKVFISRNELSAWLEEYDKSDIEYGQVDLCSVLWKRCYSSDLIRCTKTAENVFNGKITTLQELREPNPILLFSRNYRLPIILWAVLAKIMQLISHRSIVDYKKQLASCLNKILTETDEDILIVSHDITMLYLKEELKRRGFKGVDFKHPSNGELFIFESS
ncbi:MAG: histidine phosphatase family protein [Clostridia bacterium]|nr:histidine phosphatase family protein [Clostridia bacterium]